ncbi:hypothetical protein PoB_002316000 [Plakobranchus ocellatus]|uniref:Uncharacterized protein n=1 Tax=Plakobranchus ocellatus TaxID=259542 RepID=A0AAV3ZPX8_9GAST|nr:hypothetical protein PoB_002316000 [Plakobranchus ocellatus]
MERTCVPVSLNLCHTQNWVYGQNLRPCQPKSLSHTDLGIWPEPTPYQPKSLSHTDLGIWLEPTPLSAKLYGTLNKLRRTVSFARTTLVSMGVNVD